MLRRTGGGQTAHPLRQLLDRNLPAGRLQQQLAGLIATARATFQTLQPRRLAGTTAQTPALTGDRRRQGNLVAVTVLQPFDTAIAAIASLADRRAPMEAPVRQRAQGGLARLFGRPRLRRHL